MKIKITFRHMDHTESIDDRIRQKLEKYGKKHLSENADVSWTCLVEHDEHIALVNVLDGKKDFHIKASSDNMYKTIDLAIQKLESQIKSQGPHPAH